MSTSLILQAVQLYIQKDILPNKLVKINLIHILLREVIKKYPEITIHDFLTIYLYEKYLNI